MKRFFLGICLLLAGCGKTTPAPPDTKKAELAKPKIQFFYLNPSVLRDGMPSQLCYGVVDATEVKLDPPVDRVWPSISRCIEVKPARSTVYTLTALNQDGVSVTAKAEATLGPPAVRILEVSVNSLEVDKGEAFPFCVKARNAKSWQLSAGEWRTPPGPEGGCAVDHPQRTTTYTITAVGALGETDTERVTARVR